MISFVLDNISGAWKQIEKLNHDPKKSAKSKTSED